MTDGSKDGSSRRVRPIDLFRDRNYRGLWLSGACTGVVRWLEVLAASIFVFEVTGSAFQTALVTFFRFLPMVLLGAAVGTLAERLDRKKFMLATLAALCIVSGALCLSAFTGHLTVWQAMLGIFLGGALFATDFPFRRTMMGEIAGPHRAGAALAFDSVTNSTTRLLGPLGAGVLYDQVGIYGAYLLCCVLYAAAFLTMLPVRHAAEATATVASKYLTNMMEGIQFIRGQRMIVGALLVTIITNMFVVPFASLIPVIGKERMELSASLIGILASAEGIGAMIGAIAIVAVQPRNFPRTYILGTLFFMLGVLWFATLDTFLAAIAVLIVAGLGHAGFSTTQSAIMFSAATPEMRARVLGVLATCIGAGPLGVLNLGLLATWLGANWAIVVMTAEGLVLLAVVAAIWPELYRSPRPVSEKAAG
ncbi:MAG: MFS transporter [Alphaproteobacteria bacterium]|nr:MFS transporter [Alphaproteobacteria bacterium]